MSAGRIDSHTVLAGNSKLMKEMNVAYQECMSMGTVVYVAMDGIYTADTLS